MTKEEILEEIQEEKKAYQHAVEELDEAVRWLKLRANSLQEAYKKLEE